MTNFPLIDAALSQVPARRSGVDNVQQFNGMVSEAETALANGQISNVKYKDLKDAINRRLDDAWKIAISEKYAYNGKYRDLPSDVYDLYSSFYPQIHTALGYQKKLHVTKLKHPMINAMREFVDETAKIAKIFAGLKDMIVKRVPKPVEDRKAKYNAPGASKTAMGAVKSLLEKITQDAYDALVANFEKRIRFYLNSYLDAQKILRNAGKFLSVYDFYNPHRKGEKNFNPFAYDLIMKLTIHPSYKEQEVLVRPDVDKLISDMAHKSADEIRDMFVYKNLFKLDSIVEAKGNFLKGEIIGSEIHMGSLQGTLKFWFEDGSHFTVINSVVWSHSVYGVPFNRFPLNFTNVVMPDGSKMARPSEERMNTVFVGK